MLYVKTIEELQLDGGIPCLDFVNSAVDTEEDVVVERLHSYADLLVLCRRTGILTPKILKSLRDTAARHPMQASAAMDQMREIRKDMYLLFTAVATGKLKQLDSGTMNRFNQAVVWACSLRIFRVKKNDIASDWDTEKAGLTLPLRAFILSGQQLLLEHDHTLVKKCEGCAWLFLDSSKSHRRKWCDMDTCGSIAKSKRYYHKKTRS